MGWVERTDRKSKTRYYLFDQQRDSQKRYGPPKREQGKKKKRERHML
jgi:hypothetical protein